MANKTELIRQRMAQKREALGRKLDALEDRTLGVVQETTDAVVQVAESVEDTMQSARKAVKKTVKRSANLFDLNRQVDRHPWAMVGGAVAAGFFASWLMSRGQRRWQEDGRQQAQVYYTGAEPYARDISPARAEPAPPVIAEEPQASGWLGGIMEALAPSVDTLKQLAIGATLAVARDLALHSLPPQFSGHVNDLFRGLSDRLGAEDLPEPEAGSEPQSGSVEQEESTGPRWEKDHHDHRRHGKRKSHGNGRHREATH